MVARLATDRVCQEHCTPKCPNRKHIGGSGDGKAPRGGIVNRQGPVPARIIADRCRDDDRIMIERLVERDRDGGTLTTKEGSAIDTGDDGTLLIGRQ